MHLALRAAPQWDEELNSTEPVTGLYLYELRHPPVLRAHSTVTIPFQDMTVTAFEQQAVIHTWLRHPGRQEGVARRECRLKAARLLVPGRVLRNSAIFL
ncbi:hypothetical protein [Deinococcus arcticus]|nr:hypothetical protein [Deinococcus arcticus]